MNVYLITVDDHQEGMSYHICATENAADKLFRKIVKKNILIQKKIQRKISGKHVNSGSGNLSMRISLRAQGVMF